MYLLDCYRRRRFSSLSSITPSDNNRCSTRRGRLCAVRCALGVLLTHADTAGAAWRTPSVQRTCSVFVVGSADRRAVLLEVDSSM